MCKLTKEQNDFLCATGNIVLHACPGSGKTHVVVRKMMKLIDGWDRPHSGVAILSFTNVASDEVESQVKDLMPTGFEIGHPHFVGTLDSFINNFILLRFGYLMFETPIRPKLAVNDVYKLPFRYWRKECHANCVSNIGDFRWDSDDKLYKGKMLVDCDGGRYGPPCHQYKKMLFNKGIIFQGEVSDMALKLIKSHPQIATAIAERFPVIILDEAQDTSLAQMAVIDLINKAGTESMFLVGDPDQSIYEWRNATPECFIDKMNCHRWQTLTLSANFRSSQNICNATKIFAKSLDGKAPSEAKGHDSGNNLKPILIQYDDSCSDWKNRLTQWFIRLCEDNRISNEPDKIAIVTRGRIRSETDITGLWKSVEIEHLGKAANEWYAGSRKKAYEYCEKALFSMLVKEHSDIVVDIETDVEEVMSLDEWKAAVIHILIKLPETKLAIGTWVAETRRMLQKELDIIKLSVRSEKALLNTIKIKQSDKKTPRFKEIPIEHIFEKKTMNQYTMSSIHGVKGESYDALMLLVGSKTGKTLTPSFLNNGDTADELMRLAYVAMTRPRKVLAVAMPMVKNANYANRFPIDFWDYKMLPKSI